MRFVSSPLGELCRLITDGKHGDCQNEDGSGFYFLSAKDVRDGKLHYDDARQITEADFLDTHRRTQLEPSDVVISNSGTIGRMALVTSRPETSRTTFQKSVAILKPKHDLVIATWLYYYLHFDLERLIGFAGGTAQKNLLLRDLRAFEIKLHPLPTQRKIAGVLSAYDDLIENNTRRIAILEEMAQAIYREWFVNFRFPGHDKVKLINSPLGKIPEGWEVVNLFDVAEVAYGFPYKSKQFSTEPVGKPVIRIRDILGHKSDTYTDEDAGARYIVRNGDILIGMDGDFHMCRWAGGEAVLNQRVARLRTKGQLPQYVVFHSVRGPISHFNATIVGTTVAHLGDKHLREINVLLPATHLRNELPLLFEPLFLKELNLRKKNELLRKTRDLLLPKLISGQLDVEELDIETGEPLVEAEA